MPPLIDEVPDLNRLVSDFERAWQKSGQAELARFLPPRDHTHFSSILCELVCIDLEMRWSRGAPKTLHDYRREFPSLFEDPGRLQEIAFEEYRQRIQAGKPLAAARYRAEFGVDVTHWPAPAEGTRVLDNLPVVDGAPKTMKVGAAVVAALRQSSPEDADLLDDAIAKLPSCGDRIFGFELVDELGEGAFAKVFRARQSALADRPVALKVALSLNDEPRKLARLQHTNIIPIFSSHHNGMLHAVCMPFVGTLTLDHLLKSMNVVPGSLPRSGRELLSTLFDRHSATLEQRSTLAPATSAPAPAAPAATPILDMMAKYSHIQAVLWLAARIADGLAHAHDRGILHLDLKPANILLTDEGQPMLLDFNLAIDLNTVDSLEMARLGGTLPYMSPEQLEAFDGGRRDLDGRSDLYSLGVIFYELLTGMSPYPKRIGRMKEVVEALRADRKRPPRSAHEINLAITPAVASILAKLLEPDRTRRYRSAAAVREDLERHLADLPLLHAPDRSIKERARKWRRRHPRTAAGALVATLAGAFLILPASLTAYRENQIAQRKLQTETAEARQLWADAGQEAQSVRVLLATHAGERDRLQEGLRRGEAVLNTYGIDEDGQWLTHPRVALLPGADQLLVRRECGELLLFMATAQQIIAGDHDQGDRKRALESALKWNQLAEGCFPSDETPLMLVSQRRDLINAVPEEANRITIPERPAGFWAEFDAYHMGVQHAMAGRYRKALDLLAPFSERHPKHFPAWYARGVCHENVGEFTEAVACWTACTALDYGPDGSHVYFNRGIARLRSKDYARAEEDFSRALQLRPGWYEGLMNRAIARKSAGKFAGALEDLRVLKSQPASPLRARFLLGEVLELDKQPEAAKREFAAAMKIKPRDELDWSTRGYARMAAEPEAALKDLDEALALNPRSREALSNKSVVLSEFLNRPREAIPVLDKYLEYYPDSIAERLGRGVVLARVGESARARADALYCLERDRSAFFLYQAAGLYAQLSRHEKGNEARKEALGLLSAAIQKGFVDLNLMKTDSDLDPIRGEAEFKKLLDALVRLRAE